MFWGNARSLPDWGTFKMLHTSAHSQGKNKSLQANTRLGLKSTEGTNTLAYYEDG